MRIFTGILFLKSVAVTDIETTTKTTHGQTRQGNELLSNATKIIYIYIIIFI